MVITVSNLYGCGALAIAQRVAERLGLEYVDEQLPVVVAKRLRTTPEAVESAEDVGASVGERMLRGLELGTPELSASQEGPTFGEACLREVQEAVREFAARGDAVIVGRGAHAVLGRRADLLRVFMYAPEDWRIHRIMDQHGIDRKAAAAEIHRIDRARAEYMRTYYGLDWRDPQNYDLCIDTSSFGPKGAVDLVAAAARVL